jgi:hypothetical protein
MRRLLIGLALAALIVAFGNRPVTEPLPSTFSTQVESQSVIAPTVLYQRHPVRPTRLSLDNMRAPVVPLSLVGSELVPPSDPKVLGWWGKVAGASRGTTLLVGHTVHRGGGTFDNLERVSVGDIAVVNGARYEVSEVSVVAKARVAQRAPRLFSQTRAHKLVLVTCEGYNPATGHYASNVIVVARPKG